MRAIRPDQLWGISGILGVVVLSVLGWFVLIGPAYAESADINSRAADAETRVATLQRRLVELRQQNKDFDRYQRQLVTDRQSLPTTPALADLLRELRDAGLAAGTTLVGMIVGAQTPASAAGTQVQSLPVSVTVDGSATQAAAFLDQLQRVRPRAVLISSVNAVPKDQSGSFSGAVTVTVTMQVFVAPTTPTQTGDQTASKQTDPGDPNGAGNPAGTGNP